MFKETLGQDQKGFTLFELLVVFVMIAVLSALSWGAFNVYKEDAQYSRAQDTMRKNLTALQLGEMEAPDGFQVLNIADALSGQNGEDYSGNLSVMFPGGATPPGVQIGAVWVPCPGGDISQMVVAMPCRLNENRVVMWQKLCGGVTLWLDDVGSYAGPGCQNV